MLRTIMVATLAVALMPTAQAELPSEQLYKKITSECPDKPEKCFNTYVDRYINGLQSSGINLERETQVVAEAKKRAVTEGGLKIHPEATAYTYRQGGWTDGTFIEKNHYTFYLNPEMKRIELLTVIFRHGLYGVPFSFQELETELKRAPEALVGKQVSTIKVIDHEAVHISYDYADMVPIDEPVYLGTRNYPNNVIDTTGFTLYQYFDDYGHTFVSPNYTVTLGCDGSNGTWWYDNGQDHSLTNGPRMGQRLEGTFAPELSMTWGYQVFLLIRHNDDGSITMAMPDRIRADLGGYLTLANMNNFQTLWPETGIKPSEDTANKPDAETQKPASPPAKPVELYGWTDYQPGQVLDQSMISTFVINRIDAVCSFTMNGTDVYGFVEELEPDQMVCSGGDMITMMTPYDGLTYLRSPVNTFKVISGRNPEKAGETVKALNGQPLCSYEHPPHYGVGYLDAKDQCVQDKNILWAKGKQWSFGSGWSGYRHY